MRISVLGCGYLGATHAACMAELGYDVVGVEVDARKVEMLQAGVVPFFEPQLEAVLKRGVDSGRLRFTTDMSEAASANVHFICVGTPQLSDSYGADLSHVHAVADQLAPLLTKDALIVGKSTVPVGTAAALSARIVELAPPTIDVQLAWNPEFLREGHAVQDTLHPDRLVFGVTSEDAEAQLRSLYGTVVADGTPVVVTDLPTAELVKVAANAFLATKVSFINAIAEVCEVADADVTQLATALGHDDRIGPKFLGAGIGFGGGCLPKDIRAFMHRSAELGVESAMSLLREVDSINQGRREGLVRRATALLGDNLGARVAVLGAAFKPHSDDIRDSPALWIAGQLQLTGSIVTVFDPEAAANASRMYPTLTYADSAFEACEAADLVLHLTEWPEFRKIDPVALGEVVSQRQIIDGRNCLDPALWRAAGWSFKSMGRP